MQERGAVGIRGQRNIHIAIAVGVEEGLLESLGFFGGEVAGQAVEDFSQGRVGGSVPSEDELARPGWGGEGVARFAPFLLHPKLKGCIQIAVLPDFFLESGRGKGRTVGPGEEGGCGQNVASNDDVAPGKPNGRSHIGGACA